MTTPITTTDPINARILAESEDLVGGFQADPLGQIAWQAGLPVELVTQRIRQMLLAGTIRRVRQTLLSTSLAQGALVAWRVPEERLHAAFDWMFANDPFSGHVVIRSCDADLPGARYRLWTTLKVPADRSLEAHCNFLARRIGAEDYRLLPARKLFVLGVGHVRRRDLPPGSKSPRLAGVTDTQLVQLTDLQWRILLAMKREFTAQEIGPDLWTGRAAEAGVDLETFLAVARELDVRGVIGRFSTFLEHVKPLVSGERVTRFNALFHWAVPEGREIDAGREVGRFHIMTHAYWRPTGAEFNHVNIMGVAHGQDKQWLLEHKRAMDQHLAETGIAVRYSNVFWGGRSEIKPSEISPFAYRQWAQSVGLQA